MSAGRFGAAWGVVGVVAILVDALYRLTPRAVEALQMDLAAEHWVVLVLWVAQMAWSEGYRGFQKMFAPRVVARAATLVDDPHPVRVALAPLFCMGMFHATRKRLTVTWVLLTFIVVLILIVKTLPQPWRGIIDAGVVVGLSWGTIAVLVFAARAVRGNLPTIDPDLPG